MRGRSIITVLILSFVVTACTLLSNGDSEVVYAPTEVGEPLGDKVTAEIGPLGGRLSSQDERIMLTIPPNALAEATQISIQPISNTTQGGVGVGYRLEPSGKQFSVPVDLVFYYDENDLKGTEPDALTLAYQDERGGWHEQSKPSLDTAKGTITVSTVHFSDWAPKSAYVVAWEGTKTVRVGESVDMKVQICQHAKMSSKAGEGDLGCRIANECSWVLEGPGTLSPGGSQMVYTAPARIERNPTIATAVCNGVDVFSYPTMRGGVRKAKYVTTITIMDRAFRASGQVGSFRYSGIICDLSKPFMIEGTIVGFPMSYRLNFTPNSGDDWSKGTMEISGAGSMVTANGKASYEIVGLAVGNEPRIMTNGSVTGHAPAGTVTRDNASVTYDLFLLDSGDCIGEYSNPTKPPLNWSQPIMTGPKYKIQ